MLFVALYNRLLDKRANVCFSYYSLHYHILRFYTKQRHARTVLFANASNQIPVHLTHLAPRNHAQTPPYGHFFSNIEENLLAQSLEIRQKRTFLSLCIRPKIVWTPICQSLDATPPLKTPILPLQAHSHRYTTKKKKIDLKIRLKYLPYELPLTQNHLYV